MKQQKIKTHTNRFIIKPPERWHKIVYSFLVICFLMGMTQEISAQSSFATVYDHCDLTGFAVDLTVGRYTKDELEALGADEKDISAVEVAEGYRLIGFKDNNFKGDVVILTADACLYDFDFENKIKSIILEESLTNNSVATVYDRCNLQGWSVKLGVGSYTESYLEALGAEEKDISAAEITEGYRLIGFKDNNFKGDTVILTADACLEDFDFENEIKSIIIEEVSEVVATIYDHCDLEGWSVELGAGSFTKDYLEALGAEEKDISAVEIAEGYRLIGFKDNNFKGDAVILTADACLEDFDFENEIKSIIIEEESEVAATVYDHCDLEGWSVELGVGSFTEGYLEALGAEKKDISAVQVAEGYQLTGFKDKNFKGESVVLTSDACLNDFDFENEIKSIIIEQIEILTTELYVDVDALSSGNGELDSPYNTLQEAVVAANVLASTGSDLIINVKGTLRTSSYLTFDAREASITIRSYGEEQDEIFMVSGIADSETSSNFEVSAFGALAIETLGENDDLIIEGIQFSWINGELAPAALYLKVGENAKVEIVGNDWSNTSWTTSEFRGDYPIEEGDYIHNIVVENLAFPNVDDQQGIFIVSNSFNDNALGFGDYVYNLSAADAYSIEDSSYASGNVISEVAAVSPEIYTFEEEEPGDTPLDITESNGTFKVSFSVAGLGNGMSAETVSSGNTAVADLDLFPSAEDYSVSWKETYTTARRSGFILRANGTNVSVDGLKEGYLFQANSSLNDVRIYKSDANGFTQLIGTELTASGASSSRWYKATVEGNNLYFDYSDDGTLYTNLISITDDTYSAGTTQYSVGYGGDIGDLNIDDVNFTDPSPGSDAQDYTFETETVGVSPSNITADMGTFAVETHPSEGKGLVGLSGGSTGTAAADMDLFSSNGDYSITWKETYTTARRDGFILRANGANTLDIAEGIKQGYLFQANSATGNLRIYTSDTDGFTQLASADLTASGVDVPRWYRATVEGSNLYFDYSDDGVTFTTVITTTDSSYSLGKTQYTIGYGRDVGGMYIDDVVSSDPNPAGSGTNADDYTFETETVGASPMNITATMGTFTVETHHSEGKGLVCQSGGATGTAAADMDLFPVESDYSITWKETYTAARRDGFILRANGANTLDIAEGIKQGYLFQANSATGNLRIYTSDTDGFTQLVSVDLAPSGDSPRWYRATVEGSNLYFDYSDDGVTFTSVITTTDGTYSEGTTQYTIGYGSDVGGMYIDDVVLSDPNPADSSTKADDYTFDTEILGTIPSNITVLHGTFTVEAHPSEGQGLKGQTTGTTGTAVTDMDLFPVESDYSITWKETYTIAVRDGFILRANGENTLDIAEGIKQGYLFQANSATGNLRIYTSDADGFTQLVSTDLAAAGVNVPRWYRATVNGTKLYFDYSDDGVTFTNVITTTDGTYSEGTTQYTIGYGRGIGGMHIDDVEIFKQATFDTNPYVSNINPYQIIQRDNSGTTDIVIEGNYTENPTGIEARWNSAADVWTALTLDANGPGTFSGTITGQSSGMGALEVRFTNETSTSVSIENVGIGDIYIVAGQSNASGRGFTLNTASHPTFSATLFGNDDVWKVLADKSDDNVNQIDAVSSDAIANGSAWPLVATTLMADQDVPIAFVPTAKGGSSILQWQPSTNHSDASTLYGSMSRRITAVGGKVKGVLFFIGETDAQNNTTLADFTSGLNSFVDEVSSDFPGLQVMVGQIGDANFSGLDDIRAAQISVVNTNSNALLGPATYDINTSDEEGDWLHFKSDPDMEEFARRWSLAIDEAFYGGTNGYGPIVTDGSIAYDEASNKVVVPFTNEATSEVNTSSTVNANSFDLLNDGMTVTVSSVSVFSDRLELVPSSGLDVSKSITLTYASSHDGVEQAIYDQDNLPAQPFYNLEVLLGQSTSSFLPEHACYDYQNSTDGDLKAYCGELADIMFGQNNLIIAAHRGIWGVEFQENTIGSMTKAIDDGYFLVESDQIPYGVANTTDASGDDFASPSGLACFHDYGLSRYTSATTGFVYDQSKEQLEALQLKKPRSEELGDDKVMFIEDLIDLVKETNSMACMDVKRLENNPDGDELALFADDDNKMKSLFDNVAMTINKANDVDATKNINVKTYNDYATVYDQLVNQRGMPEDVFNKVLWIPIIARNDTYVTGGSPDGAKIKAWLDEWLVDEGERVFYIEVNFTSDEDDSSNWKEILNPFSEMGNLTISEYILSLGRRSGIFIEEPLGSKGVVSRWSKWIMKRTDTDKRSNHIFVLRQPGMSNAVYTTDRPDAIINILEAVGE
ncbi:MAG: sialate O-acetylesterase [Algibacter sp.]